MTDFAAMLRAVIAAPDSDLVRLQMADFLDDHRQPDHAEFIRVQIELANRPSDCRACKRQTVAARVNDASAPEQSCRICSALSRRERELLRTRQPGTCLGDPSPNTFAAAIYVWAGPAAKLSFPDEKGWTFRRGFVSEITLPWAYWTRHNGELLAACPLTGKDAMVRLTSPLEDYELRLLGAFITARCERSAMWRFDAYPGVRFETPNSRRSVNTTGRATLAFGGADYTESPPH